MNTLSPLATSYAERFLSQQSSLPGAENDAIVNLRTKSFQQFKNLDFPNKRVEEWRFTNLNALTRDSFENATGSPKTTVEGEHVAVFVNGKFDADASNVSSLPEGIYFSSLADRLTSGDAGLLETTHADQAIIALNSAFANDGYVLEVAEGVSLETPIKIHFETTGGAWHSRNVIKVGKNSNVTILESYAGTNASYFANPVTNIDIAEGGKLQHYRAQSESVNAYHLSHINTTLGANATFDNFTLTTGGKISRNEIHSLVDTGSERLLFGGVFPTAQRSAEPAAAEVTADRTAQIDVGRGAFDAGRGQYS